MTPTARASELRRKARRSARWRDVGACTRCGLPTTRFVRCLGCRRKHAIWALAWYHRQKQGAHAA